MLSKSSLPRLLCQHSTKFIDSDKIVGSRNIVIILVKNYNYKDLCNIYAFAICERTYAKLKCRYTVSYQTQTFHKQ